ncbi:hypothetical protein [Methyloprofundus sp.]|uniref:hypothetical protein n=1 Tax=Methyloprofundus sp. TaxID=2020875 RepID=UPI003D0F32FF
MPYLQTLLATKEQRYSAISTLIITLIITTPLCGFLFQCACDWPWAGLDSKCNFYKPHVEHKCPWCTSMTTGILSIGAAIIAGVWTTTSLYATQKSIRVITLRIVSGVLVFVLLAYLSASFVALT